MKSQSITERRRQELLSLRRDGLLTGESVVKFASNPKTALYSAFPLNKNGKWDDKKAAHEHRLWIARTLIVQVTITIPEMDDRPVQAFVSLKADRSREGGGYRELVSVLSDADMRNALLSEALEYFEYGRKKYESLVELAPIFSAVEKVKNRKNAERRRRKAG